MSMIYQQAVTQPKKMLNNLKNFLNEAAEVAESKSFERDNFLQIRLAPDQFNLLRQIQTTCDTAKLTAARLAGVEAPSHPDTETTWDELLTRIQSVIDYLDTLEEAQFEDAATRWIELPFMKGKKVAGLDYMIEFGTPNLYFHITSAYAILRSNGVKLGKLPFIGSMNMVDA